MGFPENKGKPHVPSNLRARVVSRQVARKNLSKFDGFIGHQVGLISSGWICLGKKKHLGGGVFRFFPRHPSTQFEKIWRQYNFWQICETTYSNL